MPPKPIFTALLAAFVALAAVGPAFSESATNHAYLARAEKDFAAAQQNFRTATNALTAWQFGRACFRVAELATNNAQRATFARLGIAACRESIIRETNSAPAHYYLAT